MRAAVGAFVAAFVFLAVVLVSSGPGRDGDVARISPLQLGPREVRPPGEPAGGGAAGSVLYGSDVEKVGRLVRYSGVGSGATEFASEPSAAPRTTGVESAEPDRATDPPDNQDEPASSGIAEDDGENRALPDDVGTENGGCADETETDACSEDAEDGCTDEHPDREPPDATPGDPDEGNDCPEEDGGPEQGGQLRGTR